jgi:hypothetical protein
MVFYTREVFDPSAAYQDNRVFLEIVSFPTDVGDYLETAGQTYFRDFTKRRVGLLGSGGIDACTYAATLRTVYECRRF